LSSVPDSECEQTRRKEENREQRGPDKCELVLDTYMPSTESDLKLKKKTHTHTHLACSQCIMC